MRRETKVCREHLHLPCKAGEHRGCLGTAHPPVTPNSLVQSYSNSRHLDSRPSQKAEGRCWLKAFSFLSSLLRRCSEITIGPLRVVSRQRGMRPHIPGGLPSLVQVGSSTMETLQFLGSGFDVEWKYCEEELWLLLRISESE